MHERLLQVLRCPASGSRLQVEGAEYRHGEIEAGALRAERGGATYPIVRGIPRFVSSANYAASFGVQWNRFRSTQLDSRSGLPISAQRFFSFTGWHAAELAGVLTLDAGCGAGRFAEIALAAGMEVIAVDFSAAVDACRENLGPHPRLHVVQADILALPLAPQGIERVYSLGVLQHTPDPRAALLSLSHQLAPGGHLAVDLYPKLLRNVLWPKYWIRPLVRNLPPDRLLSMVERLVPLLLPVSRLVGRLPGIGAKLRYLVPVVNYEGVYPLNEPQLLEWAVLDTFDMFSPAHDHPQTAGTLRSWLVDAGLQQVEVERRGFLIGRGRRGQNGAVCASP